MTSKSAKKTLLEIDGVLLLNKPSGISSNDALTRVKRVFNAKKIGHTGTLDPFASGLLPLCFGEATKFAQGLLDADKTYETIIHLGMKTTTGDIEGDVIERNDVDLSKERILEALKSFEGEIEQVPPMYSALKRDGKPLYEYAREGVEIEREARKVKIYGITFLDYRDPFLSIRVHCSKGTYIRTLGEDIGDALGCGAHLSMLRRTQVGDFVLEKSCALRALEFSKNYHDFLLPIDTLISDMPKICLSIPLAKRFLQGQRLSMIKEGLPPLEQNLRVRVYNEEQTSLLGIGIISAGSILAPERLIAASKMIEEYK